jgi:hypothetical protein
VTQALFSRLSPSASPVRTFPAEFKLAPDAGEIHFEEFGYESPSGFNEVGALLGK